MLKLSLPSLSGALISFCLYLSLVRGTNIGLFYPSDEFQLASIDYTLQTVMNATLLAGLIAYFSMIKDCRFFVDGLSRASIALITTSVFFAYIFSVDQIQSLKFILALGVVTLPAILYARHYSANQMIMAVCRFIVVMVVINILYVLALPQYGIMSGLHDGRWRGLFEHKNTAGLFFAIAPLFMILYETHRSMVHRIIKYAVIMASIWFMMKCQSSSGLVMFFTILTFAPLFYCVLRLNTMKERVAVLLGMLSILLFTFTFFGSSIENFILGATGRDSTLTGRTGVWSAVLDLVSQRPLVGFGPGMSERSEFMERIQGAVGWEAKGTHNGYLDLVINFGYPASVVMVGYILSMLGKGISANTRDNYTVFVMVVAVTSIIASLIVGFANASTFFSRSIIWIFMVIAFVLIEACRRTDVKSSEQVSQVHYTR